MHARHPSLSLSLLAGCASAFAGPEPAARVESVATLRAEGPAALARLLDRYDRLLDGRAKEDLGRTIDAVAAQRYATVSRLYWYTDLGEAEAVARQAGRPILALRMLGRLDEDLSCANSRLFRTVLYANADVSKFLRDNFVLYWSSERPVPKVTIDFGDGRKLERTAGGNSAHYVLDDTGRVIDVLPGLYTPVSFQRELATSITLAKALRAMPDERRADAIRRHHAGQLDATRQQFARAAQKAFPRPNGGTTNAAIAQRMTVSKAAVEIPQLAEIDIDAGSIPKDDHARWYQIGARAFGVGKILDDRSRTLVTRLHNAGPYTASIEELGRVLQRLDRNVIADAALNQFRLRQDIRAHLARSKDLGFAPINNWIYATVFATPHDDAWLGFLPRTDFTGVPGDGVVMR